MNDHDEKVVIAREAFEAFQEAQMTSAMRAIVQALAPFFGESGWVPISEVRGEPASGIGYDLWVVDMDKTGRRPQRAGRECGAHWANAWYTSKGGIIEFENEHVLIRVTHVRLEPDPP